MRVSFSSLAKNYNGTYSAQRQELVEQYGAYGVLAFEAIHQIVRPIYERFIAAALASGELVLPRGTPVATLSDALYLPPSMPWIDPGREAEAFATMEEHAYMSGPEIIRRRGANPRDVLDQQSAWLQRKREWGIPDAPGAAAAVPAPAGDANQEGNAE
jgi:capsid protein